MPDTRLYCILARNGTHAVIFRRGPSKQVRLIAWDLQTDTFEPGQWFRGHIYAGKADLSPDGTKLVYLAAKHRRRVMPTWIAVSHPPFLTAIMLWRTIGTWPDLSLFETGTHLALATYRDDSPIEPLPGYTVPGELHVTRKPWPGFFHTLPEHNRLVRDGWHVHAGCPSCFRLGPLIYRRPLLSPARRAFLQLTVTDDRMLDYAVCDGLGLATPLQADWADVHGGTIVFSRAGRLLRLRVKRVAKRLECDTPVELANFTTMRFHGIPPPDWARRW